MLRRPAWGVDLLGWAGLLAAVLPVRPQSQGAQDAIVADIFAAIGTTNRFYVELGFNAATHEAGSGANTYALKQAGWDGLLLDATFANASINLHQELIFSSNVVQLMQKYNVPLHPDFVSIDIGASSFQMHSPLLASCRTGGVELGSLPIVDVQTPRISGCLRPSPQRSGRASCPSSTTTTFPRPRTSPSPTRFGLSLLPPVSCFEDLAFFSDCFPCVLVRLVYPAPRGRLSSSRALICCMCVLPVLVFTLGRRGCWTMTRAIIEHTSGAAAATWPPRLAQYSKPRPCTTTRCVNAPCCERTLNWMQPCGLPANKDTLSAWTLTCFASATLMPSRSSMFLSGTTLFWCAPTYGLTRPSVATSPRTPSW